jgi:ankyrin repeat protein
VDLSFLGLKALMGVEASGLMWLDSAVGGGWTPLHYACWRCNKDHVDALISAGADVNVVATDGKTPLYYAYKNGCTDIVAILLRAGADPEKVDGLGEILHAVKAGASK